VLKELKARFEYFQALKPRFAFHVNPSIVNVVSDGYPVRQRFVTNLCAVETKLAGSETLVNATLHLPLENFLRMPMGLTLNKTS